MDYLDKFLHSVSYKFPKGYPDVKDDNDIKMLCEMINGLITENQDLIQTLTSSGLFDEYGDLNVTGAKTLKLTFSEIPNTGKSSKVLRNEVYDLIKQLVDKDESLSDYKRLKGGSSLGSVEIKFNGVPYKLIIKGTASETKSDTDVKEALVSLFYQTNIDSPFTKENYQNRIEQLIEIAGDGINGESDKATQKVVSFLTAIKEDNKAGNINFINQPLSSALAIKEVYPGQKLIRTGVFDQIRSKAQALTGLPADKWNPGDLYVQLGNVNLEGIDDIELLNNLFNDKWGGDSEPLVAISLKQEEAQGGKAKALLKKYTKVKDDYNLTSEEQNYTSEQYREGIKELRSKIQSLVQSNDNITYKITSEELEDDKLNGKYAALKSIEFLFRVFPNQKVDDAVVALAGFALSLTGVNPTFFKVTGQKSGNPGKVDTFKRGENVILYNVDGDYEPITIEDTPGFAGLKLDFKIEKGGDPYSVSIHARPNGNTQGTLEVQNINPL